MGGTLAWGARGDLWIPTTNAVAVRTKDHLYIRNFTPDRWRAGDPEGFYDGATKSFMLAHRE